MTITFELDEKTERILLELSERTEMSPGDLAREMVSREVESRQTKSKALTAVIDEIRASIAGHGNPNATEIDKRYAYIDE